MKEAPKFVITPDQFISGLALIAGLLFFITWRNGADWFHESKAPDVVEALRKQSGAGLPSTWGWNHGKPIPAYYKMDERIVSSPLYADKLGPALRSLPTISIRMDRGDLFDPNRGIYANPEETGKNWERPAFVDLIYPDGTPGFRVHCGIRVQGGWNRRPDESPKHSFRLIFKKNYGVAKLTFPLFGQTGVASFETLVLRAGNNNSWLHWSAEERQRADYLRDEWMRETFQEMGHLSARGLFVHLYLNGFYWGLYNVCERPSSPFVAANLGGLAQDYDSLNAEKVLEGDKVAWNKMLALANEGVEEPARYQQINELLDVSNLIDYMILNLYGGNADWDRSSNWYAARRRQPNGRYQFLVWDAERTLEATDANTISFDDDQSPPRLFQKLRENPEFRVAFGDHAQKHFFNQGALTPSEARDRYKKLAAQIDLAIIAESARWGAYREKIHPYKTGPYELYTRDDHWRPEIDRLLTNYFTVRTGIVLDQFRAAGLFPNLNAPRARISSSSITITSTDLVYYTDDGSDPRMPGNKVSPSAKRYTAPLALGRKVNARAARNTAGTLEWSALVEF